MSNDTDPKLQFLIDTYKIHVDHICASQARRFEILRYAFVGYFAYFAFLLSVDSRQLLCLYSFESVALIPSFLMLQIAMYIWIINRNIKKHSQYIKHLFIKGLNQVGPNLFRDFLDNKYHPKHKFERELKKWSIHYSQVVLLILAGACFLLYGYVEWNGGFAEFDQCKDETATPGDDK